VQYLVLLFFTSLFVSQSALDIFWTLGALGGLWFFFKEKTKWTSPWFWFYSAITFWVICIVSRFINSAPFDWGPLLENRWGIEALLFALAARKISNWNKVFERAAWIFIAIQIIAFVWFYFFSGVPEIELNKDLSGHLLLRLTARFGGLFPNPLFWAETSSIAGLFFLGLTLFFRERSRAFWGFLIASVFAFIVLLMTQTRGSWIGYFLVLPIYLYVLNPRKFLPSLIGLVLVVAVFGYYIKPIRDRVAFTLAGLQGQATYDNERRALWKANWMMFLDHPILGVGFAENKKNLRHYYDQMNLPADQFQSHAHNQYLQILGGTGALGFIAYIMTLLSIIYYAWKMSRTKDALIRAVGLSCLGALIFFMIASLTEASFNIAKTRYALFFIWVVVFAFWPRRLQEDRENKQSSKSTLGLGL
jgi:O-antigen ligase